MRRYISFLAAAALFAQDTARVEGRVADSEKKPIPRAAVRIESAALGERQQTQSGDDGSFIFIVPAGSGYTLQAEKAGYIPGGYGARFARAAIPTLTLRPGEVFSDAVIELTPQTVITGRVTNRSGDPEQEVIVVALRRRYQLGNSEWGEAAIAPTNDQGVYRLANLAPGKYTLVALPTGMGTRAAENPAREVEIRTYYPSSAQEDARQIELRAGQEIQGADIRLRKSVVYSVRGTLLDADGKPIPLQRVFMRPLDGQAPALHGDQVTRADGTFHLAGAPPGRYVLETPPTYNGNTGDPMLILTAAMPIAVGGADLTNVVLRVERSVAVTGIVQSEEGNIADIVPAAGNISALLNAQMVTERKSPKPFVALSPAGKGLGPLRPAAIQKNGSFQISGLDTSEYVLTVGGLPEDYYVKQVKQGDRDITHAPLASRDPLEVTISAKGRS